MVECAVDPGHELVGIYSGGNMLVSQNPLVIVFYILDWVLWAYLWIVVARTLLSWVRPNPYNPLVRIICRLVDPVTYRISRVIPTRAGMVDFSPFILVIAIWFLQELLLRAIRSFTVTIG